MAIIEQCENCGRTFRKDVFSNERLCDECKFEKEYDDTAAQADRIACIDEDRNADKVDTFYVESSRQENSARYDLIPESVYKVLFFGCPKEMQAVDLSQSILYMGGDRLVEGLCAYLGCSRLFLGDLYAEALGERCGGHGASVIEQSMPLEHIRSNALFHLLKDMQGDETAIHVSHLVFFVFGILLFQDKDGTRNNRSVTIQ